MILLISNYLKKCSMPRQHVSRKRKQKRKERKRDKELSVRFNTESNLGEDFHTFKARIKKPKF